MKINDACDKLYKAVNKLYHRERFSSVEFDSSNVMVLIGPDIMEQMMYEMEMRGLCRLEVSRIDGSFTLMGYPVVRTGKVGEFKIVEVVSD